MRSAQRAKLGARCCMLICLLAACDAGDRFGGSAADPDSLSAVTRAIEAVQARAPVPIDLKVICFSRLDGRSLVSLGSHAARDTAEVVSSYEPGFTIVEVVDDLARVAVIDFSAAIEGDPRPSARGGASDSSNAADVAIDLARSLFDAEAIFRSHCVEDVHNGWVVTLIRHETGAGTSQPATGLLVGVQDDGQAGLIGQF